MLSFVALAGMDKAAGRDIVFFWAWDRAKYCA
jgi:hypothetical protein